MKLKLPKNSFNGIKVFCSKCKTDNPICKHYENQCFRIRLHISGTKNKIKSKVLKSKIYDEALLEAIEFKNEMIKNEFKTVKVTEEGNDYSVVDSILKYYQFLNGDHRYRHLRKEVTKGHRNECIRYCKYFANVLKKEHDIETMRVVNVNQNDVANFYVWAEGNFSNRTFNKCLNGVKSFFDFLIEIEEVEMKNPFKKYISKKVQKSNIETLTKQEFEAILNAVDVSDSIKCYGEKGIRKNMYYPYLKVAFRIFLLTGCRREEVVSLKWSDILITINNIKFFKIENLKVNRSNASKNFKNDEGFKFIPINVDLFELLLELGYEEKKNLTEFILLPNRTINDKTLMDRISKSFSHYKEQAGIEKEVSLMNLRKTYLSWVNTVMMKDTRILSSHASTNVLEKHYLDPTILSVIEKGALEIKIFGT